MKILSKKSFPYLLILPAAILLIFISFYPGIYTTIMSFYRYYLARPHIKTKFVGLNNFLHAFRDLEFKFSFLNTIVFVSTVVVVEFILGLALALLLDREIRGVGFVKSLCLLPAVLAPVVVGYLWLNMFIREFGIIDQVLNNIGIATGDGLLAYGGTAMICIMIADVWQWSGFMAIALLAGIQAIPKEYFESATVDGASKVKILFHITLPMMKPVILSLLLIRTMDAFKIFDLVYVMTKGGPGSSTTTLSFYAWKQGLTFFNIGYASTLCVVILIAVSTMSVIYTRLTYRGEER